MAAPGPDLDVSVRPAWIVLGLVAAAAACGQGEPPAAVPSDPSPCAKLPASEQPRLSSALAGLAGRMASATGVHVLEQGNEAMLARAWLSQAAERSIDTQYFIFSTDNVGLIAFDHLVRAAERGVNVRVLVDDLLLDADAQQLLALDVHEHLAIKVYNPNVNLGKSLTDRARAVLSDFRGINQRMHNKTFIVDGVAAITGGRNVADEYFDFDHEYNFRDRDVLLLGAAVAQVGASFEDFWRSPLSVPIGKLIEPEPAAEAVAVAARLHAYACDPLNFWPEVRAQIGAIPQTFARIEREGRLHFAPDVRFVSDAPGKNDGTQGLGGGGITTAALAQLLRGAAREVLIQTPYLVTTASARKLFAQAVGRGVAVRILTNSLASTDNLEAFSGYARDRSELLATGVQVYEWRPDAMARSSLMKSALVKTKRTAPVFALHAKTMVIDGDTLVVGTFNLDPRSANLNTECFALIRSRPAAAGVRARMLDELRPGNAWRVSAGHHPDAHAGAWKRARVLLRGLIPKSIL